MRLTALELASVLVVSAVVAYAAGTVAARDRDLREAMAGDWRAGFVLEHAFPDSPGEAGRPVTADVHIDADSPGPARSAAAPAAGGVRGDLRVFGIRGHVLHGASVRAARGDSVQVTLGTGAHAVVLTGQMTNGRVRGRWSRVSRAETEAGHFDMARDTARSADPPRGDGR
jgi:hypothetical protein